MAELDNLDPGEDGGHIDQEVHTCDSLWVPGYNEEPRLAHMARGADGGPFSHACSYVSKSGEVVSENAKHVYERKQQASEDARRGLLLREAFAPRHVELRHFMAAVAFASGPIDVYLAKQDRMLRIVGLVVGS